MSHISREIDYHITNDFLLRATLLIKLNQTIQLSFHVLPVGTLSPPHNDAGGLSRVSFREGRLLEPPHELSKTAATLPVVALTGVV